MKTLGVICQKTSYLRQLTETIPGYLPREWVVSGYETEEAFGDAEGVTQVLLAQIIEEEREGFLCRNRNRFRTVLWLTDFDTQSADEVFMYRSVSEIAERVLTAFSGPEPVPGLPGSGGGFQIIGYIGAEGGTGCTTEAYRKAVRLAAEGKTAFLCLDNTPGLKELTAADSGVSELMYLLKEYGEDWTAHAEHCVKQIAGMSVYAGVTRIGDATEFRGKETEDFLSGLKGTDCQNLVIDFGTNGTEELILQCDAVYLCGGKNPEKKNAFLAQAANGGFSERVHPLDGEARPANRGATEGR